MSIAVSVISLIRYLSNIEGDIVLMVIFSFGVLFFIISGVLLIPAVIMSLISSKLNNLYIVVP
jgi:hypothetical protein